MSRPPAARVGLVGTAGSGKTTLFSILTGIDYARAARESAGRVHAAHVPIQDPRVGRLAQFERSKKTTLPILELVDTPPLKLDGADGALLGELRTMDALAVLVPLYADPAASDAPVRAALATADRDVMERAVEKLQKQILRPTGRREEDQAELELLRGLLEQAAGGTMRALTPPEEKRLRHFQFFSQKAILPIRNVGEGALGPGTICLKLEQDLAALAGDERREFEQMYGITEPAAPRLAHEVYQALDLVTFYTGGPNESAAWPLRRGSTATAAAASIHTDLGATFICAEVTPFEDYLAKARPRTEGKDYVVQEGDVILIRAGGERKK
jgi:ribosome-binding ATPase YchF (GTP1/OBG family)